MIQCGQCGFPVNDTMRFALMQNSCPACGSALFSNKDSNLITMIQGKISSEGFSDSFTKDMLYDVSLFVFNELKYGIGMQMRNEVLAANSIQDVDADSIDPVSSIDDDIRKEVESEFAEELRSLNDEGEVESAEVFTKAERLKRLHEQRIKNNPGLTEGVIPGAKKRGSSKPLKRLG